MELVPNPRGGEGLDASRTMYPSKLTVIAAGSSRVGSESSTTYGYVVRGEVRLCTDQLDVKIGAGAFFCSPGGIQLDAAGAVVVIERFGFRAVPLIGMIEETGRLTYIDGCSDTILCMPPRLGDPVFNHLHFPAGIVQTLHNHPSIRLGIVARGRGVAHGPADGGWEKPLEAGAVFLLHAHEVHAFKTTRGESMDVIAFHPDSDWGPTDAAHPMLNRTYITRRS
jgi:quercetin dioxygenase-like cupin family protein